MDNTDNSSNSKPGGLKITLIGYGKMGKTIEEIALQRGHSVVLNVSWLKNGKFRFRKLHK